MQPPQFLRPSELFVNPAPVGADSEDAPLLSGDVLDETARLPADLGTSGYDVLPEGQGATRRQNGR